MNKIEATIYKVDGTRLPLTLSRKSNLKTLQNIVGGLIQVIELIPYEDEEKGDFSRAKDLIINEEGLLMDLPPNPWSRFLTVDTIWQNQIFRGDIILVNGRLP